MFALIAGIITLVTCFIIILSVIILVDMGACASAYRTLKFAFNKKPPLKK